MKKIQYCMPVILTSLLFWGCSVSPTDRARVDYKRSEKQTLAVDSLKVPPGLTISKTKNRYAIPGKDGSSLSDYQTDVSAQMIGDKPRLLPEVPNVRVRKDGIFRWLEIDRPVEDVWDALKQFWLEEGFIIASEDPEAGILETDWAENRAKIGGGSMMQKLNEVVPLLVSSPERDKYRTRLERLGETKTEVFLSHEGMALIVSATSDSNDPRRVKPTWQYRPRDPNLESEMLYRMVSAFGVNSENPEFEDLVDDSKSISEEDQTVAQLKEEKGDYCLSISLSFERSWRRVGLILDSRGFSIEDKSREEGIFYIKYNDPDSKLKPKGLARLAFWRDRRNIVQSYRVFLSAPENAESSELRVLDSDGEQLSDETALKILRVIQEQLI